MNSWSPERSRKFAALVVGTLVVLAVLWQMGIRTLQGWLREKRTSVVAIEKKLNVARTARTEAPKQKADMEANLLRIQALESKMARGDLLRWVIGHVLDLQDLHDVEVTSWQPYRLTEFEVPPAVPYKSASYSFNGNAHYHNLGTFLADFENSSPFIRLKGLSIQATAPGFMRATEPERLAFQVDFCLLVSTNAPVATTNPPAP